MANIKKDRNPMIKLKVDKPEVVDPLTIEPLPESVMFEKKKVKEIEPETKVNDEQVEVKIQEATDVPIEEPLKKIKPKKPRKKRVLTQAHKDKLKAGRLKGLETRRRKAQERKARAQEIVNEKNAKYEAKVGKQVENEHQRTLRLAKKLQNKTVRKVYETKSVEKANPADPDAEFNKFFKNMSRWEAIKVKQYQSRMTKKKEEEAKAKAKAPIPKQRNAYTFKSKAKKSSFIQKQSTGNSNNPYLNFYS